MKSKDLFKPRFNLVTHSRPIEVILGGKKEYILWKIKSFVNYCLRKVHLKKRPPEYRSPADTKIVLMGEK